jgi:hypothetical protein
MSTFKSIDRGLYAAGQQHRPWIYVSGPMRLGSPWENIRAGLLLGQRAWLLGWHPVVPHLSAYWETATGPLEADAIDGANGWMAMDCSWITRCDAVVRIPGLSHGADREVSLALAVGLPVFRATTSPNGELGLPTSRVMRNVGSSLAPRWRLNEDSPGLLITEDPLV